MTDNGGKLKNLFFDLSWPSDRPLLHVNEGKAESLLLVQASSGRDCALSWSASQARVWYIKDVKAPTNKVVVRLFPSTAFMEQLFGASEGYARHKA